MGDRLKAMPYFRIIDMAFLGDKLYAITMAEDLFVLHLGEDGDGKPTVTNVKHVIKHAPGHDDDRYYSWPSDVDLLGNEETDAELDGEAPSGDDNYGILSHEGVHDNDTVDHGSDTDNDGNDHLVFDDEWTLPVCEEGVCEGYDAIQITSRHLVEYLSCVVSCCWLSGCTMSQPSLQLTTLARLKCEAVDTCTWVPIVGVLGNGRAIFIGNRFSCAIPAYGEVEEDIMYFPDTDDVFDMRSGIIRPLTPIWTGCMIRVGHGCFHQN
ncbi:hypothetical protein BRADI_3g54047v3 [Brachypodium distachyon]|uniref:DUF295 domain-containing protein n=1 Tax=Brachypodium distachyon TaxID=15368 RepID=I1IDF8_BRADI|nr:hypothetical protein BRADI_3g54047v3 [Brachypodium distachyon]